MIVMFDLTAFGMTWMAFFFFFSLFFSLHSFVLTLFTDNSQSVQRSVVTLMLESFQSHFSRFFSSNIHNLLASKEHTCINN